MKTIAILALLAAPALADEVQLRDGRTLTACIATEKNGRVEVELGSGRIDFDKKDVMSIKTGPCPLKEYPDRLAAARKSGKAAAIFELAQWCRKEGVVRHVRALLEEVVKLEPDHAAARKELGFQKIGRDWLSGDALKKAQGYVKVDGTWMTAIEAELARGRKLADKARQLDEAEERERRRLEAESDRVVQSHHEANRAAEQRRRAEQEREYRMQRWWSRAYYAPWGGYSVLGSIGFPYGYGRWTIPTIPIPTFPFCPKPATATTPAAPVKYQEPKSGPLQEP